MEVEKSRFQWWAVGGILYMYYWITNIHFKVETALLQFLSQPQSFVYWTKRKTEQNGKFVAIVENLTYPHFKSIDRY